MAGKREGRKRPNKKKITKKERGGGEVYREMEKTHRQKGRRKDGWREGVG